MLLMWKNSDYYIGVLKYKYVLEFKTFITAWFKIQQFLLEILV